MVDPSATYTDPNRANNEMTVGVSLPEPKPPACAIYVPVRTNNPKTSTNMPNFWDMVGRFQRLVPMPSMLNYTTSWQAEEVEVCWWGPFPHPCGGPFELNEGAQHQRLDSRQGRGHRPVVALQRGQRRPGL